MAVYGSNSIKVFDPAGTHLKDVILPAYSVTCPTWGGKNFDIIFCSTGMDSRPEPSIADEGGHMYRYKPETSIGRPKYLFGS
jgi:sugar lactone lactonase YvrE